MRIKPCGSMIWLIVGTITILGNPTHQYQGTILPITPSVILHGTGLLEGHRTGHSVMTKIKWGLNHKKSESSDNANTTFAIFAHICTNPALCYSSHVSPIRWEYSGYMSQTYIGFGTNCSGKTVGTCKSGTWPVYFGHGFPIKWLTTKNKAPTVPRLSKSTKKG